MGGGGTPSINLAPPSQPMQTFSPQDYTNAMVAANKAYLEQLPPTAAALADVNRQSGALDMRQFVSLLNNPGSVVYGQEIETRQSRIRANEKAVSELNALGGKPGYFTNPKTGQRTYTAGGKATTDYINQLQTQVGRDQKAVERFQDYDPEDTYQAAFGDVADRQDALIRGMEGNLSSTQQYRDLQKALGEDYTGQRMRPADLEAEQMRRASADAATSFRTDIGDVTNVRAAQGEAARMGNVADVRAARAGLVSGPDAATAQRVSEISRGATDVGAGVLGRALLADATQRLASGGRLTPQEERDVAQATRSSFAARGLATSAPAAMAEALNRDRYARARSLEDRSYAQAVQSENIGRQQNNAQRQLAALQGNQQVGVQMSLADQAALNEMRRLGYTGAIDQSQFNAANQQQANLANQQMDFNRAQFNAGNQQSMNLANLQNRQAANLANFDFDTQRSILGAQLLQNNRQFNAGNQQQANILNAQLAQQASQFNTGLRQDTNILNTQRDLDALTYNNALGTQLQQMNLANDFQQANLADSERLRQLGVQEALIGQTQSRNPLMLLLGAQQPNNQIAGLAAQTAMGGMGMGAQGYSFGINQNNSMWNAYNNNRAALGAAQIQGGAMRDAGMMNMIGSLGQGAMGMFKPFGS